MNKSLLAFPLCVVKIKKGKVLMGFLYFNNDQVLILINNVVEDAYLGPLKNIRSEHVNPEGYIMVFPKSIITNVNIINSKNDNT